MINFKTLFPQKKIIKSVKQDLYKEVDPYIQIGKLVKDARLKQEITLEELSEISRIPKDIIFSIENNDKNHRPKYPFIRSILFKLEECLSISKNSLVVLIGEEKKIPKNVRNNFLVKNFDLINTWEGSILYFLILILSLFILKKYFFSSVNVINIQNVEEKINSK